MTTLAIGNKGEELACAYLKSLGYRVVKQNFRIRGGEIDIVARDGDNLVFVEVKTRFTDQFGSALEAVTPWKIKFLLRSALFYIQRIKWGDKPYRIDVVTVDFNHQQGKPRIELIKNITQ